MQDSPRDPWYGRQESTLGILPGETVGETKMSKRTYVAAQMPSGERCLTVLRMGLFVVMTLLMPLAISLNAP